MHLSSAFRLWSRAADTVCRSAPSQPKAEKSPSRDTLEDPFSVPTKKAEGQDELAKDDVTKSSTQVSPFDARHLHSLQWRIAEVSLSQGSPTQNE